MINGEPVSITLTEWQRLGPDNCPVLAGRFLQTSKSTQSIADALTKQGMVGLTELRQGLEINANSHVGRVRVGDLTITIMPKLRGSPLLNLFSYAFGFRRLIQLSHTSHSIEQYGIEELLISQLHAEVAELHARGLLRAYIPTNEQLSSPRGRIDINRYALAGGQLSATLPCRHHPRVEDTLLNQVLVAGLRLAASLATDFALRRDSYRLAALLDEQISSINLSWAVFERVARQMSRLTRAYAPAMSIIRMLFDGCGVALEGQATNVGLPGFLFDMNSFFQSLLSRFLRENVRDFTVCDEHRLRGMMRYNPQFNPRGRSSPTPRPDYAILKQRDVVSLVDAKYRDLWETQLPREMLYQLVVYAISHRQRPQSIILYPTMDARAKEARIDVTDALFGKHLGQVCLRPVLLPKIEQLVRDKMSQASRERADYAHGLVFGTPL